METPDPPAFEPQPRRNPDPESTRLSRSDLRLRQRAILNGWATPDEVKVETIYQVHEILRDQYASDALKLSAARVVIAAGRSDLQGEKLDLDKSKLTPPAEPTCRDALLRRAEAIVAESKGTS